MDNSIPSMKWYNAFKVLCIIGAVFTAISVIGSFTNAYLSAASSMSTNITNILNIVLVMVMWYFLNNYNYNAVYICIASLVLGIVSNVLTYSSQLANPYLEPSLGTTVFSILLSAVISVLNIIYFRKRLINRFTNEKMRSKEDWENFCSECDRRSSPNYTQSEIN